MCHGFCDPGRAVSLPVHTGLILRDWVEGVTSLQEQQGQLVDQDPVSSLGSCTETGSVLSSGRCYLPPSGRSEATKEEPRLGVEAPHSWPAFPSTWGTRGSRGAHAGLGADSEAPDSPALKLS